MSVKAVNFKMEESEIMNVKRIASIYRMTFTDFIKEAIKDYLDKIKSDPYYKLTINIEEADAKESAEVIAAIEGLSDDDFAIVSSEQIIV